jgi:hypothetical protein
MKLRELLEAFNEAPRDIDLFDWNWDEEFPSMVELSLQDFTECGLQKFRYVLDAKVASIRARREGWLAVYLTGVRHQYINELASAYAGNCSVNDYKRWFTMDDDEQED